MGQSCFKKLKTIKVIIKTKQPPNSLPSSQHQNNFNTQEIPIKFNDPSQREAILQLGITFMNLNQKQSKKAYQIEEMWNNQLKQQITIQTNLENQKQQIIQNNDVDENIVDFVSIYQQEQIKSYQFIKSPQEKAFLALIQQSNKIQTLSLQKGVPAQQRLSFYKAILYQQAYFNQFYYRQLADKKCDQTNKIKKDIHRTFPFHPYFSDGQEGQDSLLRVLTNTAINLKSIGYVQGMNFMMAFILILSSGNEEETFWFFYFMCISPKYMLVGIYQDKYPLLKILKQILNHKLQIYLPKLKSHFDKTGIHDVLYFDKWALTWFIYTFDFPTVLAFWDYIIATDILSIVDLTLGILSIWQTDFLDQPMENILSKLQTTAISIEYKKVIKYALKARCPFNEINLEFESNIFSKFGFKEEFQTEIMKELIEKERSETLFEWSS